MTGNPYAQALDGLQLDDPVVAFFDFCREREQVRMRRDSGAAPPWSADPILQNGRFLNVFREDDRGSKAIARFTADLGPKLSDLVQALFFARWCNKQTSLDSLSPELLLQPSELRQALESLPDPPWCNVTAYPVEPVRWRGLLYSRLDTATTLFAELKEQISEAIVSGEGDVIRATSAVNSMLGMDNDFPIFMAIIDLADRRPDIVDPASPVPTGIGAVAYLDRLQQHLGLDNHQQTAEQMIKLQPHYWPAAKRGFQPIDIEYLSCECRKYYSYVNGTKQFSGKNRFHPNAGARLLFDITASSPAQTQSQIQVIAGGPCSGKTSLLQALAAAGHRVEPETAECALQQGLASGRSAHEQRLDPVQWQRHIMTLDHQLFDQLPSDELLFTDTSFIETLVFGRRAGLEIGPNLDQWLRCKRYKRVFFLEPLDHYQQSSVRLESRHLAQQISTEIKSTYAQYGYDVIAVPAGSIADRLDFVTQFISTES